MDIDSFHKVLEDAAAEIPDELMRELNGGISILPEAKVHPKTHERAIYIMGEYRVEIPGLGRYINLYYGSFEKVFGIGTPSDDPRLKEEIRKTLLHELRHHIEMLSGVRDLEIQDEVTLSKWI